MEIDIKELPITIKAFEDENGYALVLESEEPRIGSSTGELVKTLLVRIGRGEMPKAGTSHPVKLNDVQSRPVEVKTAKLDERGKMFITDAATGDQFPADVQ